MIDDIKKIDAELEILNNSYDKTAKIKYFRKGFGMDKFNNKIQVAGKSEYNNKILRKILKLKNRKREIILIINPDYYKDKKMIEQMEARILKGLEIHRLMERQ